jgi:hypothetical protein
MGGDIGSAVMTFARTGAADIAAAARRSAITALSAAVAALLAIAASGCAIAALWIFAAPRIGAAGAALCAAGCLLALGMAVLALGLFVARRKRRRRPLAVSPDLMLAEATQLFMNHKSVVLVAALVAGLLAGSDSREQ